MTSRILFLDIDGVLLPGRAYMLPTQTKPIVTTFDPCAVSMLNQACEKQGRKIVLHSSWIRTALMYKDNTEGMDVVPWCVKQGVNPENFHPEDAYCNRDISWRYDRVDEWLTRHPEVDDFVIVDDEPCDPDWQWAKNLIQTDFEEGITMKIFRKLLDGTYKK